MKWIESPAELIEPEGCNKRASGEKSRTCVGSVPARKQPEPNMNCDGS